jgi:hypothetical protein
MKKNNNHNDQSFQEYKIYYNNLNKSSNDLQNISNKLDIMSSESEL